MGKLVHWQRTDRGGVVLSVFSVPVREDDPGLFY